MKRRRFKTPDELTAAVADRLAKALWPDRQGGVRAIMLAGGRTPQAAYRELAARVPPVAPGRRLFLSDERYVPAGSPESNQGLLDELAHGLHVPEEHVLRVRTDRPLEAAAARYHEDLAALFQAGARVTLGLLGLGADGHTASLFGEDDVRRGPDRYAVAVRRPSPPDRISVTPRLLARIEEIIFVVSGKEKEAIVEQLAEHPASLPAGLAVAGHHNVKLWIA